MCDRAVTFTEFIDFVLVRLYELGTDEGGRLHDVQSIAAELQGPVPADWAWEATKTLGDRNLVIPALAGANAASATITGEGRLYVEGRTHETEVIEKYRERPTNFVVFLGNATQVAVGTEGNVTQLMASENQAEIFRLLGEIARRLREDDDLPEDERTEYLADIDETRRQISKREPNLSAAAALLRPLANVAAVSDLALHVLHLLGH